MEKEVGGYRYNQGKLDWSLLDFDSLSELVKVLEFGKNKYTRCEILPNKEIENIICQKLTCVPSVKKLNLFLQDRCVEVATLKHPVEKVFVEVAEELEALFLKKYCVNLAMNEQDLETEQKRQRENGFTVRNITQGQKIEKKIENETKKEEETLNISRNVKEKVFLETLLNTGLVKPNTTFYCLEGAEYVEVKKDHILTMIIKMENSEICFVVSATKLLDCYKMIISLLKTFLNISININDISKEVSGRNNWKGGLKFNDTINSLMRHLIEFKEVGDNDKESGLCHLGHIMANTMFLQYMLKHRKDLDDRNITKNDIK